MPPIRRTQHPNPAPDSTPGPARDPALDSSTPHPRPRPRPHRHNHQPHHQKPPPPRIRFDPWTSSTTGHQTDPFNRLVGGGGVSSTTWRAIRTAKLAHQYEGGVTGGVGRISDSGEGEGDGEGKGVGDGGKKRGWEEKGWLVGCDDYANGDDGGVKKMKEGNEDENGDRNGESKTTRTTTITTTKTLGNIHSRSLPNHSNHQLITSTNPPPLPTRTLQPPSPNLTSTSISTSTSTSTSTPRKIFQGLRVYLNGSTAPIVSDHRLKQLLTQHGAGVSISLGRRSVTHVILGTPNAGSGGGRGGAGGGLSASKIEKEIKRVGGCGVKYVGVEW